MAYTVMAYLVMAYIVMVYKVLAQTIANWVMIGHDGRVVVVGGAIMAHLPIAVTARSVASKACSKKYVGTHAAA